MQNTKFPVYAKVPDTESKVETFTQEDTRKAMLQFRRLSTKHLEEMLSPELLSRLRGY